MLQNHSRMADRWPKGVWIISGSDWRYPEATLLSAPWPWLNIHGYCHGGNACELVRRREWFLLFVHLSWSHFCQDKSSAAISLRFSGFGPPGHVSAWLWKYPGLLKPHHWHVDWAKGHPKSARPGGSRWENCRKSFAAVGIMYLLSFIWVNSNNSLTWNKAMLIHIGIPSGYLT